MARTTLAIIAAAHAGCGGATAVRGVGMMGTGPEAGCPAIASHFGDWMSDFGRVDRARSSDPPWNKPHNGLDIAVPEGTDVLAMAPGEVKMAPTLFGGQGLFVYHGPDDDGRHVWVMYMHLSSIVATPGTTVERGQVVARSGSFNTPHLHVSVLRTTDMDPRPAMMRSDRSVLADPAAYWADPERPGWEPGRHHPERPIRFTYPVKCERLR